MDENRGRTESRDLPQIIAILIACLNSFTYGLFFYWPSPTIPILISKNAYLETSLEMASYLTVVTPIGAILMAFPAYAIVDRFGRKNTLLLIAFPHMLSWILIVVGNSIWILYVSRFFTGIADTLTFAVLPVYIGEIATPKVRGSWGNAMTFVTFVGGFFVNVVGSYFGIRETAYIFGTVPIIFFVMFWFMPETPYYLIMKGKEEEAKKSLRWLRGIETVEDEYKDISTAVKRQLAESGTMKDLFIVKSNRRAVLICGLMRFTQQFSGNSAFSAYTQYIFNEAGGDISASTSAIIYSGITVIVSLVGSALLDRLGRRKAMFISGIGCVAILFAIGAFLNLKNTMDLTTIIWFPVVGMITFIILYSMGLGITPTLMLGEMFSTSIKSKALAVMNVFYALALASTTKIFHLLDSNLGLYAPFYFYAITCLMGVILCYCFMLETTGKTLEEIQLELKGSKVDTNRKISENMAPHA